MVSFLLEKVLEIVNLNLLQKSKEDLNKALLVAHKKENIGDINIIRAFLSQLSQKSWKNCWRFFSKSKSAINTILFDGDSIIVPKNPNTINVLGEVLNPIAFEYEKKLSRSAIRKSRRLSRLCK